MKQCLLIIYLLFASTLIAQAKNVTIEAVNQPAAVAFRSIMQQTGMNFVYSSDLLQGLKVTVKATNQPLKKVLNEIFSGTDIEYKIKGNNVILKRKAKKQNKAKEKPKPIVTTKPAKIPSVSNDTAMLKEVLVVSRLESPILETSEIGATKVTVNEIRNTPAMFGEADVVKTLHTQPGVVEGVEGMVGMYVHGGNADENLFMLENVPLYHVNHFAGLFSAFNTNIIRYLDFFKSSVPAKYDGRLSSFMDVRLQNVNEERHKGSASLGLTSGTFNICGPIGEKTTYLVGMRRSWYDVLSTPLLAIANHYDDNEKAKFNYHFMDFNARISHNFSPRATAFVNVYFGEDKIGTENIEKGIDDQAYEGEFGDDIYKLQWGNFLLQTGLNYRFKPELSAEFTAAHTKFFSNMKHDLLIVYRTGSQTTESHTIMKTDNNINDWILRGDFDWRPDDSNQLRFGASYERHSFLPARTTRHYEFASTLIESRDSTWAYGANELNAYIEDDCKMSERLRMNIGLHTSLFHISSKVNYGLSPRLSVSYRPTSDWAVKGAYSRTTQYVHQLAQTYLSLPTNQWIPITGKFKPQTADKISLGGYWQTPDGVIAASVEGYYKWMHNLIDYRDEYYLRPPLDMWNSQLCSGKGTAKGVDFKVEKKAGKLTGHIAYSLAWADRTFADKNGGRTFPARFDNRHTINVLLNWKLSEKLQLNTSWIGHSGNRFTLLNQVWNEPLIDVGRRLGGEAPLKAPINGYQLTFYHRLDLSLVRYYRRGYLTLSFYNAYCHMNTIAVTRGYDDVWYPTEHNGYYSPGPVFKKVKLLPIIPSISYTWLF